MRCCFPKRGEREKSPNGPSWGPFFFTAAAGWEREGCWIGGGGALAVAVVTRARRNQ